MILSVSGLEIIVYLEQISKVFKNNSFVTNGLLNLNIYQLILVFIVNLV